MFIGKLREDMLKTRQRRYHYQITKITAIATYFAASGIIIDKINSPLLYYVIPFISLSFDLFILSESYTLRRMAAFLRINRNNVDQLEADWEKFVKQNPDSLSSIANSVVTIASSLGAFLLLLVTSNAGLSWFENGPNMIWFTLVVISLIYVRLTERKLTTHSWKTEPVESRG
jgi:hypothetical protein